jgi:DNA replication and repair protein RecF
VIARGSSYRSKDTELVKFDQQWARLDSNLANGQQRTVKILVEPSPQKTFELDGKIYKRLMLNNSLPVVLFEPNNLQLLSGGPERRREYLDDLLEQTTPGYSGLKRKYKRALAQRNALLKQPQNKQSQMFPWDIRLSELAGQIVKVRTQLVSQLDEHVGRLYVELSKTKTMVQLNYLSRWGVDSYESSLLKELESTLELDKLRGYTGAGPHREDFGVMFDSHPAQETASRGEVRTVVLTLKITELRLVEDARGSTPLLLLDDVFSELDGKRRHTLIDYLTKYQTFITTTDADLVVQHFTESCNIIPLG